MESYTNPYAPPQAGAELYTAPVGPAGDPNAVPDAIVEQLRGTRPWVIFLAIVGFLVTGLLMMGGLGMIAVGSFAESAAAGKSPFPVALLGLVYFVGAGIYVLPSIGMLRYGTSITALIREPRMDRLGTALNNQRWFWKALGIMTAVFLALYPVIIIVAVFVTIAKIK